MPSIAESLNAQPGPDSLAYWLRPFQGFMDRQKKIASEGLSMADQGAQQVRGGDLSGLAGMIFGPAQWAGSYPAALFPVDEAYTQLPKEVSPFVAGGLELMALAAPGPKGGKMRKVADAAEEGITAYHGSPHTFDKFDMSKIGTGEGAQVYGHGLYFAEKESVARSYRDKLSGAIGARTDPDQFALNKFIEMEDAFGDGQGFDVAVQYLKRIGSRPKDYAEGTEWPTTQLAQKAADWLEGIGKEKAKQMATGSMYQVRLNVKPDELLDWDRPLSEQPAGVQDAINRVGRHPGPASLDRITGDMRPVEMKNVINSPEGAAALKKAGIKGIRYKDAGSRDKDGGTYNYVIFDDKLVDILKRYGITVTAGAGGAAIVSGQDMPPEVASQLGPQA